MSPILLDLKLALRLLASRPGFTFIMIATLALGIGANTAIFSVVKGVLYETAPFDQVERLVWLGEHSEQVPTMSVAYPNFLDWQERSTSFDALAAHRYQAHNLTGDHLAEQIFAVYASAPLFSEVLRVEPQLGRTFSAEEDQPGAGAVVVVSHGFWQGRMGGTDQAIGQKLLLDGDPYEVIGVMPPGFVYPLFTSRVSMWLPIGHIADEPRMTNRNNHPGIYVTGRLADGVELDQAHDEMISLAAALAEEFPDSNTGNSVASAPLRDFVIAEMKPAILVLTGAVFLVLLIACVNVANLLLARGAARVREMAVRNALGAGHWRVVRQLLTESLLISLFGGLAGIFVAFASLKLLVASLDFDSLPVIGSIGLDGRTLAFALILSLITGVLFGLAPALQAVRRDVISALKEGSKGSDGGDRLRLRSTLVVVQVALALVLLVGAMLFLRSFTNLIESNPGFDAEDVLTFSISLPESDFSEEPQQTAYFESLLERVRALPGVGSAAATMPLLGGWQSTFVAEGRPAPQAGEEISVDITRVSSDYFRTLGVDAQRGRVIDGRDRADTLPVAVIDRTFAELHFAGQDPIGQRIKLGSDPANEESPWLEIVGVVDHVKNYGVDQDSRIEMYQPMSQRQPQQATLAVKTLNGDPRRLVGALESELAQLSTTVPMARVRTLEEVVGTTQIAGRVLAGLLSVFGGLAMLLAALGIYGVMALHVTQRQREIGIRMALGAAIPQVQRLIAAEGLKLVLLGITAGWLCVFFTVPMVASQLFGVEPRDPLTLVTIPLLLVTAALFACLGPLLRASRVEPIEVLRYE